MTTEAVRPSYQGSFGGQADSTEIRSLFLNLKDKGNPALRNKIVLGDLDADAIVAMSKEAGHLFYRYLLKD
jgi:hypothetical protein